MEEQYTFLRKIKYLTFTLQSKVLDYVVIGRLQWKPNQCPKSVVESYQRLFLQSFTMFFLSSDGDKDLKRIILNRKSTLKDR